jgi:RNA polymerase sigma factor (sigma-70 family)
MMVNFSEELIRRSKDGDEGAIARLFQLNYDKALRVAFGLLGDRGLAEDAVQEGFTAALRTIQRLQDGVPFEWWLLRSVTWSCRAELRRQRRMRAASRVQSHVPVPLASEVGSEDHLVILDALRGLGWRHREVIIARFYLELSERETAHFLGCRQGTVKSRTSRALEQLGRSLIPIYGRRIEQGGSADHVRTKNIA